MSSIFDETHNFIRLYLYATGRTEVPESFHLWSCLSLIASALGNNVWYEKFPGDRLYPNLYVILLGPSGLGKGTAINKALKFAQGEPLMSLYRGKMTEASLIDLLDINATPRKLASEHDARFLNGSRLYYVTPELGMSLGTGTLASGFVKFMTEMFTGDEGVHNEGTRTSGQHQIVNPILNWLAGTTDDWLVQSIPPDAISGGFFARTIVVKQEYDLDYRLFKPELPKDAAEVKEHLKQRLWHMCRCQGQFSMTLAAEQIDKDWYCNRHAPDDEQLIPIWKREHDLVYKLAMILRVSDMLLWDGDYSFRIEPHHLQAAQLLLTRVRANIKDVIALAGTTQDTKNREVVRMILKKAGRITRSQLLRRVSNRGVNGIVLNAILMDLKAENQVRVETENGQQVLYWIRRVLR